MLERKFQSERTYKFRHGIKRRDGLPMCQEITIAKIAVNNLVEFCTDKGQISQSALMPIKELTCKTSPAAR